MILSETQEFRQIASLLCFYPAVHGSVSAFISVPLVFFSSSCVISFLRISQRHIKFLLCIFFVLQSQSPSSVYWLITCSSELSLKWTCWCASVDFIMLFFCLSVLSIEFPVLYNSYIRRFFVWSPQINNDSFSVCLSRTYTMLIHSTSQCVLLRCTLFCM